MDVDKPLVTIPYAPRGLHRSVVSQDDRDYQRVVITGIGLVTSLGWDRETVWREVRRGHNRIRPVTGLRGIADGEVFGATVDVPEEVPQRLKVFPMTESAADEALADARVDLNNIDKDRFACSIASHMGDSSWIDEQMGLKDPSDPRYPDWWGQFLPNSNCVAIANRYGLAGPRMSYSTACASSLVSVMTAAHSIRDDKCDIALVGGAEAIDPLFVAGFQKMRVLASGADPSQACRPYDRNRNGFVMGEGAVIMVVERLKHALDRGATIYAEIAATKALAEAHHVTGLDAESEALSYLISSTLRSADMRPCDVGYINAHGTGTAQNDLVEMRSIRHSFGSAVDSVCVSSNKSTLGHMVNAAGGVELAITALAMRDGFAPPTLNLIDPDPELCFDCLPQVGRDNRFQNALKLSCAFGGHLVAVALRRWNEAGSGFAYPYESRVA